LPRDFFLYLAEAMFFNMVFCFNIDFQVF